MSQLFFSESIKYSVINAYSQTNDSYEQVLVGESKNVVQPVVIHEEMYMSQFFLVTYIKMQCDQCWFTNNWLWDDSF